MREFDASAFVYACQQVSGLRGRIENKEGIRDFSPVPEHSDYPAICEAARGLPKVLRPLDSPVSMGMAGDLVAMMGKPATTFLDLEIKIKGLESAMRCELERRTVLVIADCKEKYFRGFGKGVKKALPDATPHIDEASKCLALGRNAGCVYHAMLAMEIGVRHLGTQLKVKLTDVRSGKIIDLTWGQILGKLREALKLLPQTKPAQKLKHEQLSARVSHLTHVKDALRNPTMHPRSEGYSEQEAEDILRFACAFITSLQANRAAK